MKTLRKAVIPVAGLGTRFLPATKAQPKEMLPLVDTPVIQYVVEEAIRAGVESLVLVTGRGKAAIENHFDVSWRTPSGAEASRKTSTWYRASATSPSSPMFAKASPSVSGTRCFAPATPWAMSPSPCFWVMTSLTSGIQRWTPSSWPTTPLENPWSACRK